MNRETLYSQRRHVIAKALKFLNSAYASGTEFRRVDMVGPIMTGDDLYNTTRFLIVRLKNEKAISFTGPITNPLYKALRRFDITEDLVTEYCRFRVEGSESTDDSPSPSTPETQQPDSSVGTSNSVPKSIESWPTVNDACKALGLARVTVKALIHENILIAIRDPHNIRRIDPASIQREINRQTEVNTSAYTEPANPSPPEPKNPSEHSEASDHTPSVPKDPHQFEQALQGFFDLVPHLVEAISRIEKRLVVMDKKVSRLYQDLSGEVSTSSTPH